MNHGKISRWAGQHTTRHGCPYSLCTTKRKLHLQHEHSKKQRPPVAQIRQPAVASTAMPLGAHTPDTAAQTATCKLTQQTKSENETSQTETKAYQMACNARMDWRQESGGLQLEPTGLGNQSGISQTTDWTGGLQSGGLCDHLSPRMAANYGLHCILEKHRLGD